MIRQTDLGGLSNYSVQVWCEALRAIDHLADLSMLHGWNTMKDLLHEVLWGEGGKKGEDQHHPPLESVGHA